MNLFSLSGLLIGITSLAMGIFVFIKNPRSAVNRLWCIFTLCVAIWGFGAYKIGQTQDAASALEWWKVTHIGVIFIPAVFFHFTCVFLGKKNKYSVIAAYLAGIFFLFTNLRGWLINNVEFVFNSFYYDRPPTLLYSIFTAAWFAAIIYSHILLFLNLRTTKGVQKEQIKYFFLATAVGFSGGGTCFFPVFGASIYPYGNFTVPLYPLIMTYAIIRYRLMNITVIVNRSLLFIILLVLAAVFHAAFVGMIQPVVGYGTATVISLAAIVLVFSFTPLRQKIRQLLDSVIYRGRYKYQQVIRESTQALVGILDLDQLLKYLMEIISQNMGVESMALFLKESADDDGAEKEPSFKLKSSLGIDRVLTKDFVLEEEMLRWLKEKKKIFIREEVARDGAAGLKGIYSDASKCGLDINVPLFFKGSLSGVLSLSQKISGEIYSVVDFELLESLAMHAAIAVENARLYTEAITDGLTGLYHHKCFKMRLAEEVARSKRYKTSVSLLMIDADDFKKLNDTYGHQAGDKILKELARLIKAHIRQADIAARYGGEEFSVILPETGLQEFEEHKTGVAAAAERLRRLIENQVFRCGAQNLKITVSMGVAFFDGKLESFTAEILIGQADEALYRAKAFGKNKVCVFDAKIGGIYKNE